MKAYPAVHRIATMCRVLGVSPSGYYAWQHRAPSARAQRDAELTMKIHTIHLESRGTYGAPRVHAELAAQGIALGRKRVARLMHRAQLRGVSRRKWVHTTTRNPDAEPAPDLVQRQFTAPGRDQLWVADITYVPTGAGFLYLAVVLDAWSRRVIGWAMETHLRTELVLAALDMALDQRRPSTVIHHSDHGCQYTSIAFGQRCDEAGVRPSMGSVGDAYDNALCESFFATLECELLDRTRFRHIERGPRRALRLHRGLVQSSPAAFRPGLRVANPLRAAPYASEPDAAGPDRKRDRRIASTRPLGPRGRYLPIPPHWPSHPFHRARAPMSQRCKPQPFTVHQTGASPNPILRGWVNYFRIGQAARCFAAVRYWVEQKVRRHLMRARHRQGFGWKRWSRAWLHEALGLFEDYRVRYMPAPDSAPGR